MKEIKINRVFVFLFFTFLISWGFDWLIIGFGGSSAFRTMSMSPWGMLVPALVAIVLQMFFFKDSPIYYQTYKEKPRWIFFGFIIITFLYGILTLLAAFDPESGQIYQGLGSLLYTLWILSVFFIRSQSDEGSFERAGLRLGKVKMAQRFIGGILLFLLLQAGFNLLFKLGSFVGKADRIYGLPIPSSLYIPAIIVLFVLVTVIGVPLSGIAGVFGEEYGWRGFLQSELIKLGNLKGVLLVGLIWGIWHFPVILRGVHTYPASLLGLILGTVFFVLWGIIQGYAVLKTGSIWVAAFMHGLVNSVYGFLLSYVVKPENKVFSFGIGIYGLICLLIVVGLILRDPVWKKENGGIYG